MQTDISEPSSVDAACDAPSVVTPGADGGDVDVLDAIEMVARARGRDVAAIRQLYVACSPVYAHVHRRYKDAGFAKEIFHDTVTEIWRGSAPFQGQSKFSTWATAIARNLAADVLRKRGDVRPLDIEDDDDGALARSPSPQGDPFDAMASRQQREAVGDCLRKLSPKLGEVLTLVYYAELPQTEIAQMLSLNINTVKTRVRDAHSKVRSCVSSRMREFA